jgi:hypothetical protein
MNERQREAIKEMLLRRTGLNTQTSELAQRWLKDEGLLDEEGKLRPEFGGDGSDEEHT